MARSPRSISPSAGCLRFQRLPTTKAISKPYPAASTSARKLTTSSAPSTLPSTVNFRKRPGSTSLFPRFSIPRSPPTASTFFPPTSNSRSEEHTSELQSQSNLVCRLLLEKKKKKTILQTTIRLIQHRTTHIQLPHII